MAQEISRITEELKLQQSHELAKITAELQDTQQGLKEMRIQVDMQQIVPV